MPVPHVVARFNRRYTNRFVEPIARRFGGVAVVHHVGRRSGRPYATPVRLFGAGDTVLVVLTYGLAADWIRNVLGSGGSIETEDGVRPIDRVEIVDRGEVAAALPRTVRAALRILTVRDVARFALGPAVSDG